MSMPVRITSTRHQDDPGDVAEGDADADSDLRLERDRGERADGDAEDGQAGECDEATAAGGVHHDGRDDARRSGRGSR